MMKNCFLILYWFVAVLLVAMVMLSFEYTFAEAMLVGMSFLPGALAAKYFFPKAISKSKPRSGYNSSNKDLPANNSSSISSVVYISIGIVIAEFFLIILAHIFIASVRREAESYWNFPQYPDILENPIFIAILVAFLAIGYYFLEQWINEKYPAKPGKITFSSDRRPVSLERDEILYVESNDTVTIVHATCERCYKNSTPISQWEAILGEQFIRIHRSFIVNKSAVSSIDADLLYIGDKELPISRKYKDSVKRF